MGIGVYVFISCFRQRFEVVSKMNKVPVFSVHTDIVLVGFVLSNIGKALLEVQGVTHQVEKQSQEEVTPVFSEPLPPGIFSFIHTITETIALRWNF